MAQTPEGKIKAKLDKMLNTFKPNLWFYSPQSGIYGKSGVPDRMGCFYGLTIGIECKAGKNNKPTDLQMATMLTITKAGGKCFVVYDAETIEHVRLYLEGIATREGMKL